MVSYNEGQTSTADFFGRDWLVAYTSTRLIGCELLMIGCLYDTLGLFMQKYPLSLAPMICKFWAFLQGQARQMQAIT